MSPGGRELFAPVLRFYPKGNFFPFQFSLAMGCSAMHGGIIRNRAEGSGKFISSLFSSAATAPKLSVLRDYRLTVFVGSFAF